MVLNTSKKHYICLMWGDAGRKGGMAFQADKNQCRGILAGIEGISGKKAVTTPRVPSGGTVLVEAWGNRPGLAARFRYAASSSNGRGSSQLSQCETSFRESATVFIERRKKAVSRDINHAGLAGRETAKPVGQLGFITLLPIACAVDPQGIWYLDDDQQKPRHSMPLAASICDCSCIKRSHVSRSETVP